ncbi:MAG: hypothetical protein HUJ72_11720 [Blautia sp.]|nr:hypothetical protein [Blautia sp.]
MINVTTKFSINAAITLRDSVSYWSSSVSSPRYIFLIFAIACIAMLVIIGLGIKKIKDTNALLLETEEEAERSQKEMKDRCDKQILKLKEYATSKVRSVRADCAREIEAERQRSKSELRRTKENIENRRDVLRKRADKELLIDVIVSLDGYATRIDRIEDGLKADQVEMKYDAMMDMMNAQFDVLANNYKNGIDQLGEALADGIEQLEDSYTYGDNVEIGIGKMLNNQELLLQSLQDEIIKVTDQLRDDYDSLSSDVRDIDNKISEISISSL